MKTIMFFGEPFIIDVHYLCMYIYDVNSIAFYHHFQIDWRMQGERERERERQRETERERNFVHEFTHMLVYLSEVTSAVWGR